MPFRLSTLYFGGFGLTMLCDPSMYYAGGQMPYWTSECDDGKLPGLLCPTPCTQTSEHLGHYPCPPFWLLGLKRCYKEHYPRSAMTRNYRNVAPSMRLRISGTWRKTFDTRH